MIIMKTLIIFALMAFAAAEENLYVLEKVDINGLSSDTAELKNFTDCLIDKGPCTDLYKTYRDLLAESLQQTCKKCTVAQKHFAHHYFDTLKTKLPEDYAQFRQISDPENKYFDLLETELSKYKTI